MSQKKKSLNFFFERAVNLKRSVRLILRSGYFWILGACFENGGISTGSWVGLAESGWIIRVDCAKHINEYQYFQEYPGNITNCQGDT
jgi:hypothetical protein